MIALLTDWPGKSPMVEGGPEHPALYHMLDVAAVAEVLLQREALSESQSQALALLVALHDLGKVGEMFRDMLRHRRPQALRHWEVTEVYLHLMDERLARHLGSDADCRALLYAASAGHHGRPPDLLELGPRSRDVRRLLKKLPDGIVAAEQALAALADLWPKASLEGLSYGEALALSWWLPGLISTADWIGSNVEWFAPRAAGLSLVDYLAYARRRAPQAVQVAGLLAPKVVAEPLFDFALRPMQAACRDITLPEGPALAVIEDETGAGKTEAALILAQRMLMQGKGRGLFFALPTMATADAMFGRVSGMIERLFDTGPSVTLAHGRAGLSVPFRDLVARGRSSPDAATCSEWLADDRRRALLADVGVGTVDQALLAALPTRFNTLRHYGLSSKILIVDEVHELGEPYIGALLEQLLRLHHQAGGSAILLTATLPLQLRSRLMRIYGQAPGSRVYPALSMASGAVRHPEAVPSPKGPVRVSRLDADAACDLLVEQAARGAACVWVRNAVDDAIAAVQALRARGVAADLLHARFTLADRKRIEGAALARFGKTGKGRAGHVLVGTQVLESSLDLDFDVMVSDLAPMAALIQRAGRLWRHMDLRPASDRPVPEPVLWVVSPDPGQVRDARWLSDALDKGAHVYPLSDQWRTADHLFRVGLIEAPEPLRDLIEAVHGTDPVDLPEAFDAQSLKEDGARFARRGLGWQNVIRLEDGFRTGGFASDDRTYPTRLGIEQLTLVLARRSEEGLFPIAGRGAENWPLSEVTASKSRLERLPLPDQTEPPLADLVALWPDWKREQTRLCIVAEDGAICEGLRYDRNLGLLFS